MAEPSLIRMTLTGVVTLPALLALAEDLEAQEAVATIIPHRLTDLTAVTDVQVSSDEIRRFTARRMAVRFPNPFRSAIVANEPLTLGYARMFQILNDHPDITVRIFSTVREAEVWLAS